MGVCVFCFVYVFVCACMCLIVCVCIWTSAEGGDEQTTPAGDTIKWVFLFFV